VASPKSPLVSVIVPVFNGARFLGECLESLLAQEHPALDIVVVDDGSSDGSGDLAERFSGVRVLRRSHEGLPATRNAGLGATAGPLIGFCDADDRWKPEKARRQVEYLESHPDVAVVLCRQDTFFEPGIAPPGWLRPDQVRGDLDGISPTSGLFRRSVFDRLGGFREVGRIGSDFDLLVRLRTADLRIALLEDSLCMRRIHDDNMMSRSEPDFAPMFQIVRDHLRNRV
jgi:glycosyltransferase involved in cell wall biosynthesis